MSSENYCKKCGSYSLRDCPQCKGEGMIYVSGGVLSSGSKKQCKNCNGSGKLCPKHGNNYS